MSLTSIVNNSYRILGVFSNASKKDIERNKSRFAALLRVNKPIPSFPSDLNNLLPPVERNPESISKAESEISISKGKLVQSFFWFVNVDNEDQECLQFLSEGRIADAIERWKKAGTISSLQNILVYYLIYKQYRQAISLAYNIFTVHLNAWRDQFSILSESDEDIAFAFLDCLYNEIPNEITSLDWNGLPKEWESYIKKKTITPLSDAINSSVEISKGSNSDHPEERIKDAKTLISQTQPLLAQMEELLAADNLLLQACEDKVHTEILNCCIASYNMAFDLLTHGNESLFRDIAPSCYEILNNIDTKYLSENVRKRVEENREIINEKCSNLEKTIEEGIAYSDNICWFCGSQNGTLELKKTYSYESDNMRYTKTVTIHLCKDCQHEMDNKSQWKLITGLAIFALTALIVILFGDFWMDMKFSSMIFSALLTLGISMGLGAGFGGLVRKLLDNKNIRHFKRDIDDHPLVKLVKSEGYR